MDSNVVLDDSIVFGIIVRGIIVRVNIVWGLFDGNISASGIIVHGNIVWGLFDGNISASWNIGRVHKSLFGSLYLVKITFSFVYDLTHCIGKHNFAPCFTQDPDSEE